MKLKNIKAFTFVEMIVVITIIAILATIGFTVYQSYLDTSRDTNRVVQLSEIEDGLRLLSVTSRLPLAIGMISLEVGSGTGSKTFAFQGFAGPLVMQAIGYTAGGKDPEYGIYPTYMLSENRKNFQLLTYVQDAKLLSQRAPQVSADTIDFQKLFPKIAWDPLGILIEKETQIPLQLISSIQTAWIYNISTGTGDLQAYFSDTVLSGKTWLIQLLPNQNCKRILDLGNAQGNGIYNINPTGTGAFSIYCDMTTNGGGWTLVARSVAGANTLSFGWFTQTWSLTSDSMKYSLGPNVQNIFFDEIMFSSYTTWKKIDKAIKVSIDSSFIRNPTLYNSAMKTNSCTEIFSDTGNWRSACDTNGQDGKIGDENFTSAWGYFYSATGTINTSQYFFRSNALTYLNHGLLSNWYVGTSYTDPAESSLWEFLGKQGMIFIR